MKGLWSLVMRKGPLKGERKPMKVHIRKENLNVREIKGNSEQRITMLTIIAATESATLPSIEGMTVAMKATTKTVRLLSVSAHTCVQALHIFKFTSSFSSWLSSLLTTPPP